MSSKTLSDHTVGTDKTDEEGLSKESMIRKVLVVEASAAERQTIRFILSREEMELDFALSCREAKKKLGENHYELAIIDEEVEDFSLEELLEAINREPPNLHIPILLLSREENADEFLYTDGEIDCRRVAKPFSSDALKSAVQRLIAPSL